MLKIGQATIALYAVAIFLGGLEGFVVKHSVISIIASAALAACLFYTLRLTQTKPKLGLGWGSLLCILSLGQFTPKFVKLHHMWPSGFYTILGTLAGLIIGVAFLTYKEAPQRPGSEYPV